MDPSSSSQRPQREHTEEDRAGQWAESWPGKQSQLTTHSQQGTVCTQLAHLL